MDPLSLAILGENGDHVELRLEEVLGFPEGTSHFGGYDARCRIKSAGYAALGELWTSTWEVALLAAQLKAKFEALTGTVEWETCEGDLHLTIRFGERGTIHVCGDYRDYFHNENRLVFSFEMDQTYLLPTFMQLEAITAKYGDHYGITKRKRGTALADPSPLPFRAKEHREHRQNR